MALKRFTTDSADEDGLVSTRTCPRKHTSGARRDSPQALKRRQGWQHHRRDVSAECAGSWICRWRGGANSCHNRERDTFHESEVGNRGERRAGSEAVSRTSGPPSLVSWEDVLFSPVELGRVRLVHEGSSATALWCESNSNGSALCMQFLRGQAHGGKRNALICSGFLKCCAYSHGLRTRAEQEVDESLDDWTASLCIAGRAFLPTWSLLGCVTR